jgi:hypothetical protein
MYLTVLLYLFYLQSFAGTAPVNHGTPVTYGQFSSDINYP